jgi:FkbM family methyltransferase
MTSLYDLLSGRGLGNLPGAASLERRLYALAVTRSPWATIDGFDGSPLDVKINPEDMVVSKRIYNGNDYEPETTEALADLVEGGDTVLDVGANIGYVTLLVADRVGPAGSVLAVEPEPTNYRLLSESVRRNGFDWVDLRRVALSDAPGRGSLNVHPSNKGKHSLLGNGTGTSVAVDVTTLDELDVPDVDLVKVDVEGAEPAVIRGGRDTLRDARPIVVTEFNTGWLAEPEAYLSQLDDLGYRFESVTGDRLTIPGVLQLSEADELPEENLIAFPDP